MKHLHSSINLLLLSTLAFGQVPNTFSSRETISSSKINANFSFLANAMGSGNVSAMMKCDMLLFSDEDNPNIQNDQYLTNGIPAFSSCYASDNISLPKRNLCNNISMCYSKYENVDSLTFQYLLNNSWLLHMIDRVGGSSVSYYFYKVSSD